MGGRAKDPQRMDNDWNKEIEHEVQPTPDLWEERIPKVKIQPRVRKPPTIEKWFGFDSDSEGTDDTNDNDWLEIDRKKKREEKKRQQKRRKKEMESLTSTKASSMVGIGPIDSSWVDKHRSEKITFED